MYPTNRHITEDGTEYRDCFVDFDGIIRLPYGRPSAESVTHWAYLPTLPGMTVHSTLARTRRRRCETLWAEGLTG
jgi:hypothetical protein